MSNFAIKHGLYQQVATIGKALGHETRLEIIEALAQCPQTVEKLSSLIHTDIKSVSAHLKVLLTAGLVIKSREGRHLRYFLASPQVPHLLVLLRQTAETALPALSATVAEHLPADPALSLEEAVSNAAEGKALLLDVRPREEYDAGHLPHAVSLPIDAMDTATIYSLPTNVALVTYCRSPYCFVAKAAAKIMASHGRFLHVVQAGVMEWESRGHDVERTFKTEPND